jgi:hypothetical protein
MIPPAAHREVRAEEIAAHERHGEIAIPRKDGGPPDGAPMDCSAFPVVWRRHIGLVEADGAP